MPSKLYEVASHGKRSGVVVLASFGTPSEAVSFARDAAINCAEPAPGDSLLSITVTDTATRRILSTFYPDRYEADCLDDDDDG